MARNKALSKAMILRAMKYTKSNRSAAKYLGVSHWHYRRFALVYRLEEGGPSLYEIHRNQSGKGIPKFLPNKRREPNVKRIFEEGVGFESFTPDKIKERGIAEGYLKDECYHCGFKERRITDYKIPLLLNFKDGLKNNYLIDNLELVCYNCYFLHVADPLTKDQVKNIENNAPSAVKDFDWELSKEQIENMKSLGLWEFQEETEPGSEFISYKK